MKRIRARMILAVVACFVTAGSAFAGSRGITAEDYFAVESLSDPRFSPDGSTIAFVVTAVEQKQNRRRSEIRIVPADGSREAVTLTTAPQSSTSPRWRPDGQALAFLSARPAAGEAETNGASGGARSQVWLLPLTGEPKHLVESILWQVYWFERYFNGNANAVPPDVGRKTTN